MYFMNRSRIFDFTTLNREMNSVESCNRRVISLLRVATASSFQTVLLWLFSLEREIALHIEIAALLNVCYSGSISSFQSMCA